ncbi:MAG: hypothetical protein M3Y23_03155, partial [Actinomycetota bacterium]|nr:hypothetical protein [Actinomycetota bacterium]
MTDPLGRLTTFVYDRLDRLTVVTQPDPAGSTAYTRTTYVYDQVGNQTGVTDPNGNTTHYAYDARDRLATVTDALSGTTVYGYDLVGNMTAVTDPVGNVTAYAYDRLDRVTAVTDPNGKTTTYLYDTAGQLTATTDRMGRQTTFAYDLAGRQTAERWLTSSGGTIRTETYTYDSGGQLIGASDPDATLTFTYDFLGRQTSERTSGGSGQPDVTLTSGYDKVGNRTSLTDNFTSVGRTTYTYDALDRLTTIARSTGGAAGPQVVFTYDVGSRRTSAIRTIAGVAGSVNSSYGYDGLDRVTAILHSTSTVYLTTFTYGYDAGSRLTHDTVGGVGTSYSYDVTDQLTGVSGGRTESYDYDANGNRDSMGYSTDTGNRVTQAATALGTFTYSYDDESNRSSQTDTGSGAVTTYAYDQRNRLTGITIKDSGGAVSYQTTYTYDALDRRIGELASTSGGTAVRTWTVYDGREEYADVDGSGAATRYLHGPAVDELLARTDNSGNTSWYLTDRQGSIRNIASSGGSLVGTITYDGFGRQLTNTGATERMGYTGRPFNAKTGLQDNDRRPYDVALGRFIQDDPIGFRGGDPNLSRYVGNSPTNRSDPSGLDWYDYIPPIVGIEALYVGGRESARGMELDEQRAQI